MNQVCRWAVALLALSALPGARADAPGEVAEPSYWELGIGLGSVRYPAYPGAVETRSLTLPFPYVVYHNPHLSVDKNQVRGIVIAHSRWSVDVDTSGSPYVQSDRTRERVGMPDLQWLGQLGPALRYLAWQDDTGLTELDVVLPFRAAVSAQGLTLTHRGWESEPRVELDHNLSDAPEHFEWDASLSFAYNDRRYDQYYYGVQPQYAIPERPAYDAPGGYGGYRSEIGFSWYHGGFIYGAFIEYTNLQGAVFQSSPLLGRRSGLSLGVAVSWVLHRAD